MEGEAKRQKVEEPKDERETALQHTPCAEESKPENDRQTAAQPTPPVQEPKADVHEQPTTQQLAPFKRLTLASVGLSNGTRLQVLWNLEFQGGEHKRVWWGAELRREADDAAKLVYDAAFDYPSETRDVTFSSGSELWDCEMQESLAWRLPEPDAPASALVNELAEEDEDDLAVGSLVRARLGDGETSFSAVVHATNDDGTLDLAIDDKSERKIVTSVPADRVESVLLSEEESSALDEDRDGLIDGTDEFFEVFVRSFVSSARFQQCDATKKALVSAKVRSMRPYFLAELEQIKQTRGVGATVTDSDIHRLLPRAVERMRDAGLSLT